MIHKITVENFYSIAESQVLDFTVHRNAPEAPCFVRSPSREDVRLPVVIGFFGANASGKSTVLKAVVAGLLTPCISFDQKDCLRNLFQPYRHKSWVGRPTKIIVEFDARLNAEQSFAIFRYELHIAHQPNDFDNKTIVYEALFYAPKGKFRRLFERHAQEFYFGQEFGISNINDPIKDRIRPDASVLSTLKQFNDPLAIYLIAHLGKLAVNRVGINKIEPDILALHSFYLNNTACLNRLNQELRRLDVGIDSMRIEQTPQGLVTKIKHIGLDGDLFLPEESQGTRRFIELFPHIYSVLETGGVAVIDEIDAEFHPLLLPEIFRWFMDRKRNQHSAQLLFSGHNPAILDELEKEQIFFTEKTTGNASYIYGAKDIKLRREPSLMKKYLSGELGAVPHVG